MWITPRFCTLLLAGLLSAGLANATNLSNAQAQGPAGQAAKPGNNLLGTVTAQSAESLTIRLESGTEAMIAITPQTRLLRTAPGEKTLKGATMLHMEDLATGDRVLILRATPGADATHFNAAAVVAMKQGDIAQAHASQSEDWQRRGVGGIVKTIGSSPAGEAGASQSAGPAAGSAVSSIATIVVGTAQPGRTLSIQVTPATTIRRYAPDSVNFADAKTATLADIHPGDQLRARGERSADGVEVSAVEIVAGSFRNVAGTITAIDAAQNTVTVTDLATKKPVTLKLTAETQMRKLPLEMAQRLAARTSQTGDVGRSGGSAPRAAASTLPPGGTGAPAERPSGEPGRAQMAGRGDPSRMLQSSPPVTLAELKKGDALMVVASRSGGSTTDAATAITLIAGVEPLLESSSGSASQNLFSASWNLNGGGAEAAQP